LTSVFRGSSSPATASPPILRGPGDAYVEQVHFPTITLEGDSRLVVPVTDGTLGGAEGVEGAPLKPFLP
jgi:hypothetical protein